MSSIKKEHSSWRLINRLVTSSVGEFKVTSVLAAFAFEVRLETPGMWMVSPLPLTGLDQSQQRGWKTNFDSVAAMTPGPQSSGIKFAPVVVVRSEERRVGKECRS